MQKQEDDSWPLANTNSAVSAARTGRDTATTAANSRRKLTGSKAKNELKKFIFYDNLYGVHKKSIQFNEQSSTRTSTKPAYICSEGRRLSFEVPRHVNVLVRLYLDNNNEKSIFENNQVDLEIAVEVLNGYLEKELLEKEDLNEMRRKIMDSASYLEQRKEVLLRYVK
ncbi:hypothetical protein L596_024206 [Steinernema carpocapsae]|uniref:Uncharacterized protein n=1 Tax=Steinernema carpocapsae TaxID=34508 RepID=A0A4U5MG12_STECR|nr:hypothetical protein L596_024206 [Steinernema carpocapsae]